MGVVWPDLAVNGVQVTARQDLISRGFVVPTRSVARSWLHVVVLTTLTTLSGCGGCARPAPEDSRSRSGRDQDLSSKQEQPDETPSDREQAVSIAPDRAAPDLVETSSVPSRQGEAGPRPTRAELGEFAESTAGGRGQPVSGSTDRAGSGGKGGREVQGSSGRPALTAAESLDRARRKQAEAKGSAERDRPNEAYPILLEAWELVNAQPDDPGCRQLKDEIEEQLESLAERANAKFRGGAGAGLSGKVLIAK